MLKLFSIWFSVPLTYLIISRDVMLIAAVFYVRYRTLPTPRTLAKYFNPCYATARLKPTFISKVNTAVQLILVAASLAAPVFNYADSIYLQMLWCFTAFTTAASAYSYYHYGRKTVQVIKGRWTSSGTMSGEAVDVLGCRARGNLQWFWCSAPNRTCRNKPCPQHLSNSHWK